MAGIVVDPESLLSDTLALPSSNFRLKHNKESGRSHHPFFCRCTRLRHLHGKTFPFLRNTKVGNRSGSQADARTGTIHVVATRIAISGAETQDDL